MLQYLRNYHRIFDAGNDAQSAVALRTDLSINFRGNSLSSMSAFVKDYQMPAREQGLADHISV
jgi:hypothetical protein